MRIDTGRNTAQATAMHRTARKILVLILALAMCLSFAGHVFGAQEGASGSEVSSWIEEILNTRASKAGAKDLQELIWYFADNAGQGEEWYITSIRQFRPGEIDYSEYRAAYEKYVQNTDIKNVTSRQRAALTLLALGSDSTYPQQVVEGSTGTAGIMSWIYALHILNNGVESKTYTADSVIDELLKLQLEDGGWAVMGDNGDVDVTAMTVQSLAPHYAEEKVKAAVDRAVDLLSRKQLDNGNFASFGDENPESTAQVLVALSSLGIDCTKDERFIKGGKNILDVMRSFRIGEGEYAHTAGGAFNPTATIQTLYSLVSYDMMTKGSGNLYVFGEFTEPHVERPEKQPSGDDDPSKDDKDKEKDPPKAKSIKPLLYGITAAAAVAACVVLLLLKKRSYKSYLFVLILAAVAAAGITFINIEDPSDYYGRDDEIKDPIKTEIYISAATVAGRASHIPADGILLPRTEIIIDRGQNASDQIIAAVRKYTIQIDSNAGYVSGIGNIYEFDFGDLSGWMFKVNGEFSSVGAIEYILQEGDYVEWLYTTDLGKDIGDDYMGQ